MNVNKFLIDIYKCAETNNDPHVISFNTKDFKIIWIVLIFNFFEKKLEDFMQDEFLPEQVDDIKEKADLLTKIERATKYVTAAGASKSSCDGLGVHIIDRELDDLFDEDNEIYKGLRREKGEK